MNAYDDESRGARKAKIALGVVGVLVVAAIIFGFYQMSKAIAGNGMSSNDATEQTVESVDPTEESTEPEVAESTDSSDGTVVGTGAWDGGASESANEQGMDFGSVAEMPSFSQAEVDRILGETTLVDGYIGLAGKEATSIDKCQYLSKGYIACPIGGPYVQIIDSLYQQTYAFAKSEGTIPSNVVSTFKKTYSEAIEGTGTGGLEGYSIISRANAQDLTVK